MIMLLCTQNTPSLRTTLLILATVFGVLPLGMLRSIDSLSHFSAISLTFYVVFALHVHITLYCCMIYCCYVIAIDKLLSVCAALAEITGKEIVEK